MLTRSIRNALVRTMLHRVCSRRASGVLLSALYLLALFASPLHLLLVEHERCSQHGEFVHSSEHTAAHQGLGSVALQQSTPDLQPPVLVASAAHGDHDHCSSCAAAPEAVTLVQPSTVDDAHGGDGEGSDPVHVAALMPTHTRYLLAPKQSPPV